MARGPRRIRLSQPGAASSYELIGQHADGSLLLRPERERLSDVLSSTKDTVFRDEEFVAHLERVAATEDDLRGDGAE